MAITIIVDRSHFLSVEIECYKSILSDNRDQALLMETEVEDAGMPPDECYGVVIDIIDILLAVSYTHLTLPTILRV